MEFKKQFKEELIKEDAWISLTNEQRESVVNIAEQQLQLYIVSQQRELLADEKCDKLLQDLDNYARNYDNYDYGLPINFTDDSGELNEQRLLIKNWFKANCG